MAKQESVHLKPIETRNMSVTIIGTSSYIPHQWSEKAKKEMRDKKQGKKTKERTICVPEDEAEAAAYKTQDGRYGIPLTSLKMSIISAAHKDIGIEKTLVRKAFFIPWGAGGDPILPMRHEAPTMREDYVRVGVGGTDLRYRLEFPAGWEVDADIEFDSDLLKPGDIINLIERAGFGVGIGEMRPEKGGQYGRFKVKVSG